MTHRSIVDTPTLLTLARSRGSFFTNLEGDAFAELSADAGGHVLRLRSEPFRAWLDRACYEELAALPSAESRREVLSLLEAAARFEASSRPVHTRLAEHDGAVFLDLGGPARQVVRIDAAGWRVDERSPVAFFRPGSQKPIPRPEPGGSLHALTDLFPQLSISAFRLVVGWMVGALRPAGPYPMLILQGERGSGKSSLARAIKLLLDASMAPLRAMPKGERDLLIGSKHAWVGVYDNLGPLSAATSDAFCRISTGGGIGTRKLFTDQDESVLDVCRPVILTGIEELATRPDLAERAIVVRLPPMPGRARRDEASLSRLFDTGAPGLLGALLDGVSAALAGWHREEGARLPRMADFARWVSAAEPALGWEKGTFLDTYERHRSESDLDALEHDAVAPLVLGLPGLSTSGRWTGTATQLWLALTSLAERAGPRPIGWPKSASRLTGHLRNIAPLLRAHGVELGGERTSSSRVIVVTRRPLRHSLTA